MKPKIHTFRFTRTDFDILLLNGTTKDMKFFTKNETIITLVAPDMNVEYTVTVIERFFGLVQVFTVAKTRY